MAVRQASAPGVRVNTCPVAGQSFREVRRHRAGRRFGSQIGNPVGEIVAQTDRAVLRPFRQFHPERDRTGIEGGGPRDSFHRFVQPSAVDTGEVEVRTVANHVAPRSPARRTNTLWSFLCQPKRRPLSWWISVSSEAA